jgi:uncharacterized protein YjbI with pentapeptide repeats
MKRKFKDNILFQPIKVESYSKLFSSLVKTVLHISKGNFDEAASSSMEVIEDLGIEDTEEQLSWKLINRSVIQAITDLVKENLSSIGTGDNDIFTKNIKKLKYDKDLKVDSTFFKEPKENAFVKEIQNILFDWFQLAGVDKHKSKAMVDRFPSFFVYALNDEWAKNSKIYKKLLAPMEAPFFEQTVMEDDWEKYKAYLDKQTQESIFGEAFSLSQIYIPLCAYYKEKENKIVVNLDTAIRKWLNKKDRDDSVRIISGGPGSGKSSFVKMFAASIINEHKVLFVPLYRLNLDNDIQKDINRFLESNKFFEKTPIGKEERLLIIFDGLDELSMQGKIGADAARDFVMQVKNLLANHNQQKLQLRTIITGRDLPIQEIERDFKKDGQVLHVMPYCVESKNEFSEILAELKLSNEKEYIDDEKLLNEDKRNSWWKKYGQLTGKKYKKLPEKLSLKILTEITAQPLLNYLLALSYERGEIKFAKNTNRNDLYRDLINAVYKRGWQGEHLTLKDIKQSDFELVLEEIAVSVWQGAGRTTTVEAIKKRCEKNEISNVLTEFQENAEKGVLNLLVAFYFRQSGKTREGDKTFEFTHKSFGEYLTARKIVQQLQKTKEALELQKTRGFGWTKEVALENWIDLCSNVPLDLDIHKFLCDEMLRHERSKVGSWQDMLCELISYMLEFGMPFEKISPRPKYIEETQQSRNIEEALLAALSACSRFTKKISKIKWAEKKSAGEWLSKLCVQSTGRFVFAYSYLNNIDFSKCVFLIKDFSDTNLVRANLTKVNLSRSDLSGIDLSGADLGEANLLGTIFNQANLSGANLSRTDLRVADLGGANLSRANLLGTMLNRANLSGANLSGADLRAADLSEADLSGAKLTGADSSGADFRKADLRNTINLFSTTLKGAFFQKGDLNETDLQKAIDKGVIIKELKKVEEMSLIEKA